MTLDEAIIHAEEVIMENLEKANGRKLGDPITIQCILYAEEHMQLAEWLRDYKRLKEQTRLIPMNEMLPEKDDLYLVYFDDGEYNLAYFSNGAFSYSGVIAWMPLPELYKAESEDKE